MKRNKLRYQSKPIKRIEIIITGRLFLQYRDDESLPEAVKGDLLLYPQNDQLHTTRQGDYEQTGFSGYFKVDVSDGKVWQPVLLNAFFIHRENYFSRTERPIDTYNLCAGILEKKAGTVLLRTYREHYAPEGAAEQP